MTALLDATSTEQAGAALLDGRQPRVLDNISPAQEQVLRGLRQHGGTCAYKQVARACYGLRWEDLTAVDRKRLANSLRQLEAKGLVSIARRWGAGGYGQPGLVSLTAQASA